MAAFGYAHANEVGAGDGWVEAICRAICLLGQPTVVTCFSNSGSPWGCFVVAFDFADRPLTEDLCSQEIPGLRGLSMNCASIVCRLAGKATKISGSGPTVESVAIIRLSEEDLP